ncbi:hypothetical protein Q8A73_024072 [Channa argus]|nr:hypothetical protein Q8A73_024072 [Channa argus]
MAFANQGRSIPWVGLRRTLRFQWRSSDREVMPRDLFCTRIIKGQLNLTVEDVFCIQWHQQATGYDVSFVSAETHQAVTARCSRFFCTQMLKVLKGFSTPLHSPAEAIRADASVRVTLVPGGGDLRVKLSQYTDDTTLLLDSDECVVRALEVLRIFEGSQELGSTLANVQRPLVRTIFDFLWGGRYEWVALGRMMSGLAEGGRHVPDLPLKLDTIFVASLLQDMASEVGHPASIGMKYFFLHAARGILNWSNVGPRSEQLPWHYALVAKWLRAHPKALEDGIWKQQRVLYRVVRGKVNPSPLLGVPSSVTVGVQAVGQSNGLKDLNWAFLHRTLPVRDKIHRHGLGRSPLCPRPSCGAGETAYQVMWECSFARQLWAKAKKVVGRAKPDLTLSWQVVERGFVGAHIRSGWGILWLLLSLYKRGLWLARQELVRNEVEWSGVQRGWLKGGDLRVKLSQYADDTTLLLDSDECVVRALELFEDFGRVSGARHNIGKCTVKGGVRVVMLLRVDYQRGHALHYVFPLPVAIRRPLARTIFDFLWGGRYEWVALGRMMSGLAEGGRDVPDLPLKLDTIFVASLLQDMASEVGHPASIGMKYFFLYAARGILNWSNVGPRSEQLPWHYALVAKWLRAHPKALEDGIWKQQRVLYRVVRGKVNPSPLLGVPSSVTVGVQAVGQSNGLKDLNWAFLHKTLPVRDKIHNHGLGRSPLCPRPSCGAGETAYHVMWECSFARQLWAKAKKVVGRAKPDLTLTWQVVERGFVGAHIRSGWGILWLLLSLYKRGLWLSRQELVRNGVEWSGLQRGWLRGSNGR